MYPKKCVHLQRHLHFSTLIKKQKNMKKTTFLAAALMSGALTICSCGGLGALTTPTTSTTSSSGIDTGNLLGGLLGQLIGGLTNESSIVGTWVYSEPSVQFESENFLAQAGGAVASSAVVNKVTPYYQKIGITPGAFKITFNQDHTCTYTMKGQTYNGTYSYDSSNKTISIKGQILTFPSAYVTVTGNQMALTFDSTKLLTLAQGLASASQNATLSTLSSLSKSFNGMKTGFMFKRQ